jgi:phage terminase large subunit-like protein
MLDEAGKPLPGLWPERLCEQYQIQQLAYDKYNATKLITELSDYDGINTVEFGQGYLSMNFAAKEFERRVSAGTIRHGNNPVAAWMAGHCVVDEDPAGNIKPTKKRSRHKIDGIVCAVMTTGLRTAAPADSGLSIYNTPGQLSL